MNLLGQAYFSKLLIEKFNPRSLKSIAICEKYDNVIVELAKKHGIEVVVFKDNEYEEKFDDPKYINKNKSFH
jgi:hypothetical protein